MRFQMSGSALKGPPAVNLDEFERRLRVAGSRGPQEDPLDELARLVGADAHAPQISDRSAGFAPRTQAAPEPPVHLPHIDESTNETSGFGRLLHVNFGEAELAAHEREGLQE